MKKSYLKTYLLLPFILLVITACGSSSNKKFGSDRGENESTSPLKLVKVFKYDQSIQCEWPGIPLQEMQVELIEAGVEVICKQKGHDGLVRIDACGESTGLINIFQIHTEDLPFAEANQFMNINVLTEYVDIPCES